MSVLDEIGFVLPVLYPGWLHHTSQSKKPQPDFGAKNLIPVTNAIEALNAKLRRAVRKRGYFFMTRLP